MKKNIYISLIILLLVNGLYSQNDKNENNWRSLANELGAKAELLNECFDNFLDYARFFNSKDPCSFEVNLCETSMVSSRLKNESTFSVYLYFILIDKLYDDCITEEIMQVLNGILDLNITSNNKQIKIIRLKYKHTKSEILISELSNFKKILSDINKIYEKAKLLCE